MARNKKRASIVSISELINIPKDQTLTQPISASMMKTGKDGYEFSMLQQKAVIATIVKLQEIIVRLRDSNLSRRREGEEKLNFFDVAPIDGISLENGYPVKLFFKEFGVSKNNYAHLHKALKSLSTIPVRIPIKTSVGKSFTKDTTLCDVFTEQTAYSKYCVLTFKKDVLNALINTDFGVQFVQKNFLLYYCSSTYTLKMYYLINGFKEKGMFTLSMSEFRERMGIEGKYPLFTDVKKRILEPSKKELSELAKENKVDCYFAWERVDSRGRTTGNPEGLCFYVKKKFCPQSEAERRQVESVRNAFRNEMERFKIDSATIDKYVEMIDGTNYARAISWFCKVNDRLYNFERMHLPKVNNPKAYIKESLINFFENSGEQDMFADAEEIS